MFGTYTIRALMIVAAVCAIAGFLGGRWTCHPPAPVPLTPTETKQLGDAGFHEAKDAPIPDPTPALPGKAAQNITVTMPRRHGGSAVPSEPGQVTSGAIPGSGESPTGTRTVPAPILPGLTSDDLSGTATVRTRLAGDKLWAAADLTCCAGEVCRTVDGTEVDAGWDRAAMCGRPRLARGWEIRAGGYVGRDSVAGLRLGASGWRQGRHLGWWGDLDIGLTSSDLTAYQTYSHDGYPGVRSYLETQPRDWRVGAGIAWRFGQ